MGQALKECLFPDCGFFAKDPPKNFGRDLISTTDEKCRLVFRLGTGRHGGCNIRGRSTARLVNVTLVILPQYLPPFHAKCLVNRVIKADAALTIQMGY